MSYEELTQLLLTSGPHFVIEEVDPRGKVHRFTGRDVTAFVQRQDHRRHEHKVFGPDGTLIYHRDMNGRIYEGSDWQKYKNSRERAAGRVALTALDIFRDAWDRAMRLYGWRR
jgi:hypothetical protein